MPSSTLNLSDLDGNNGFVINGLNPGDGLGFSVSSAGDINGDGIDDLIISDSTQTSYVVFGSSDLGSSGSFDLSTLDGSNGFQPLDRVDNYQSANRAGDINGDGIADLIIGAPGAYHYGSYSRSTYVVFGSSDLGSPGSLDLSRLNGSNGFTLNGFNSNFDSPDLFINSAGDINGDGIDDLIIGESVFGGSFYSNAMSTYDSYVVFGGTDIGADGSFDLSALNGSNGFRIHYNDLLGRATNSVSSAGDINGDGIDDLIIGLPDKGVVIFPIDNPLIKPRVRQGNSSVSYVVFGGTDVGGDGNFDINSLDGSNGFAINGVEVNDRLGWSVSGAGDINGDGIADLIIGAPGGGYGSQGNLSSKSYVLFGGADIATAGSNLSLLDGSNGFVINGINPGDGLGYSVSSAGDLNGDGIDDLIIGAPNADPNGSASGSTYIVFGGAGVGEGGSFDLSSLDGNNGFVLNGINLGDRLGFSVSGAGDVNGDGIDDVIIGAPNADPNGIISGSSYVVFGSPVAVAAPTPGDDTILGTNAGDVIRGGAGDDLLDGRNGNDTLLGNRGNDVLVGGNGDDLLFGGWGKDVLTGGAGSDRFILSQNTGTDTITDFESGIDSLVLLGNLTFEQITITQSNNDTLLSLASNNQVIANLTGVSANTLSAADFINL